MNPVTGLSLGRIAIGTAALARPDLVTRMFGVDVAANPQAGFVARLFGSREVALGVATLAASGRGRTVLVLLGAGVDLADAVAGHLAPREQGLEVLDARVMTGVASGAVLSGLLGLRTGTRGTRRGTGV
jgi:hypothetical protein